MRGLVVDTHTAIWYSAASPRLSVRAREAITQAIQAHEPVFISSISLVEMVYLIDKRALEEEVLATIESLLDDAQSWLVLAPVDRAVADALPAVPRAEVPEMPDRITAATAVALALPLVTVDDEIQRSRVPTIW